MKIGLVCPYNIARGGGVLEIVRALQKELRGRGHEAVILTPQPRDLGTTDTTGVIFVGNGTDFRSPLHTTSQLSMTANMRHIDEVLQREQFDVLHFHEPWVPMLSRQILTRSTSAHVATFHAKVPETMMSRTLVKVVAPYTNSVMKYLDKLTAVSEASAEWVRTTTDDPVRIIPNALHLDDFKSLPPKIKLPSKTIFYVGRLERRKGVRYLIEAFALLNERQPDTHLVLAGDGPDREKLEQLVAELELPNVTFAGYISDKQKMQYLASADLFCSPAIYGESFGIVLLEAMAAGLPLVAGDNSGYTSVMQDYGAVSLVNPRDTTDFARRLDLMLNQETLRKDWKIWARQYITGFDYPEVVDQYFEVYEEAVKNKRKLPPSR